VADTYRNFRELQESEPEGEAWARDYRDRGSRILIMAPHGGWIEPLTTELARSVAGRDLSFYSFRGIKEEGNGHLHITSHRFDEPLALEAAAAADRVVAIHGERTRGQAFVMVGGRCEELRASLEHELDRAGFIVHPPREGLDGKHRRNICNRGRHEIGGQLEVSEGLRERFQVDEESRVAFIRAVRAAILPVEQRLRDGRLLPGDG
jgi:phage replication-related protein YjqB (UPF0714/DUF867 family)